MCWRLGGLAPWWAGPLESWPVGALVPWWLGPLVAWPLGGRAPRGTGPSGVGRLGASFGESLVKLEPEIVQSDSVGQVLKLPAPDEGAPCRPGQVFKLPAPAGVRQGPHGISTRASH